MIQLFSWSLQASTEVLKQRHQDLDQQLAVWMPFPGGWCGHRLGQSSKARIVLFLKKWHPHPKNPPFVAMVRPHHLKQSHSSIYFFLRVFESVDVFFLLSQTFILMAFKKNVMASVRCFASELSWVQEFPDKMQIFDVSFSFIFCMACFDAAQFRSLEKQLQLPALFWSWELASLWEDGTTANVITTSTSTNHNNTRTWKWQHAACFVCSWLQEKKSRSLLPNSLFFFCWLFYPKALQENIDQEAEVLDPGGIGGTTMESKWDNFVFHWNQLCDEEVSNSSKFQQVCLVGNEGMNAFCGM